MKNLVLIDGQNFYFKAKFDRKLSSNGENVHMIYGFCRNLIALIKKIHLEVEGQNEYVICWDGGYNKRLRLSEDGVCKGIIDKTYKQDRRDRKSKLTQDELDEIQDEKRQQVVLKGILKHTLFRQIQIMGEEADDIIASLCKQQYENYKKFIIVSTDEDYNQLLNDKVIIYKHSTSKQFFLTKTDFVNEYNIQPWQWVDLGAFTGDRSDTIIGVYGMGVKTTLPYIKEYNTYQKVLDMFKDKVKTLHDKYGNIHEALENKTIKKLPFKKVFLTAVDNEQVIHLAYKLKKMDDTLSISLPDVDPDKDTLYLVFKDLEFISLYRDIDYLVGESNLNHDKFRKIVNIIHGGNMDNKMIVKKGDVSFLINQKEQTNNEMIQGTLF